MDSNSVKTKHVIKVGKSNQTIVNKFGKLWNKECVKVTGIKVGNGIGYIQNILNIIRKTDQNLNITKHVEV